jgi:hypothetical protein
MGFVRFASEGLPPGERSSSCRNLAFPITTSEAHTLNGRKRGSPASRLDDCEHRDRIPCVSSLRLCAFARALTFLLDWSDSWPPATLV